MQFRAGHAGIEDAIAALFTASFTASEGAAEGALIGDLARALMATTPDGDLHVFTALEDGGVLGAIMFSRLTHAGEARSVFVLGPVAVAPDRQGEGLGQRLIAHGLQALRRAGVDIAVTYGDPAYYGRVGFQPVSESMLPAPFPLRHPHGWQAQSLNGAPMTALTGPCACVPAFNDPAFW